MISEERYNTLKEKYGDAGSWAIWAPERETPTSNVGNMSVFSNPDICKTLNPNYVFVGLNRSTIYAEGGADSLPAWNNYHSSSGLHNDYKLRYALKDTKYWGAYMTDIIKRHVNVDAPQVLTFIKHNPDIRDKNFEWFREELRILGTKPVLVAMGSHVAKILHEFFGDEYKIIDVMHFSYAISKENYRKRLLEKLAEI